MSSVEVEHVDTIHEDALWQRHDYLVELIKDSVVELQDIKAALDVGEYV